ncbi:hypothetical protein PFJ87_02g01010 [Encephalitozoon hellem]|uniref:Uncharacterized protein n=1 Tax=Encephalitozoon hellem TaxID=27973 RepID=A0A9Q9F906_ENCHE|nr:hypothetical protein GPU96_02g03190 [Encephalitozoon hellem]WEL38063.1 hypothetical protein PFJ87_02g01010 [Encephalitozoon hellem]
MKSVVCGDPLISGLGEETGKDSSFYPFAPY